MTRSSITQKREDELFAVLEECAVKGERCPTVDQLQYVHNIPTTYQPARLARQGRIRVEVWRLNWRVIEIMEGPNKGRRTQEAPTGTAPYKIIYKDCVLASNSKPRKPVMIIDDPMCPKAEAAAPLRPFTATFSERTKFTADPDQRAFEKALDDYNGGRS